MPYFTAARQRRWLQVTFSAAAVAIAACGSDRATVAAPEPVRSGAGDALERNARLADRIIGDGSAGFARPMAALRGHPVVVNQWASWCGSCRFEFSVFDRDSAVARSLGGGRSWPMTFFFHRGGEQVHTRIGAYATVEQLEADIKRFALGDGW